MPKFRHFMSGALVYVTYDSPAPNRLREMPKRNALVLDRLAPRTVLEILGGPAHDMGHIFWQVRVVVSGRVGWTSQGTGEEVYLQPVIEYVVCPGVPQSQLQRGDRAMVPFRPHTPTSVFIEPGGANKINGEISPGGGLTIVDGPVCVDGCIWWEIQTDSKVSGWTHEYSDRERQLWPTEVGYDQCAHNSHSSII